MTEAWKAWAVPWKLVVSVAGIRSSRSTLRISFTASPSATPGLRLKEMVTAGSWPRWLTVSGPTVRVSLATAFRGTSLPELERT